MKITLLTAGSRGDVQPFVALGVGLKKAGYDVTLCTHSYFEPLIQKHGLKYAYMNDELRAFIQTRVGRKAIASSTSFLSWLRTVRALSHQMKPILRRMLDEAWQASQDADMIIFHPKIPGFDIAQKLNIPCCMALTAPFIMPTKAFAHFMFPEIHLGGWYNKLTYKIMSFLGKTQSIGFINDWLKETLNMASRSLFADDLVQYNGKPIPLLHCFSSHLIQKPADWPASAHITGFWFLDQQSEWQPSEELVAFLQADPPPIYVGFGSMAPENPQQFGDEICKAIKMTGQRAIIATGWGGIELINIPKNVLVIESAPHDWLFERVSAIVHHGGAGTTAAALRAGKPMLIVPFFGDQPFWGQRIYQEGVGAKPIAQKKITSETLAKAINEITTDTDMIKRAELLGQQIRDEDGVHKAVKIMQAQVQK